MRQLDLLLASPGFEEALAAARERLAPRRTQATTLESATSSRLARPWGNDAALEAIILERLRPPYFIRDDKISIVGDFDRVATIRENLGALENACLSVGRVDLLNHETYDFVGTGWMIRDDIAVTNRHVAETFAESRWTSDYPFKTGRSGRTIDVDLDFLRQSETLGRRTARVSSVLYISHSKEPDFAFLKVEGKHAKLNISSKKLEGGMAIAAVGYPAWDGDRNDPRLMAELFGGVYDVKRFAPGLVTTTSESGFVAMADYTSLGGNSGSAVIDLENGEVVGLHFAGVFKEANYFVPVQILEAALRAMANVVPAAVPLEAKTTPANDLSNRRGYDPEFLGSDNGRVPLPGLLDWTADVAKVGGVSDGVLRYEHFSVVQSKSRRLPIFTAVNIDGEHQRKFDREGDWRLDGRLSNDHQIGNELYRNNPLDRGHMVRRRDPGWGSDAEAKRGEADTFHYTNSVPQHEDLNQKDWVRLEDYVLGAAETLGFRVSVFTGPVLRESDRALADQPGAEGVAIPEEFWKIAVMVSADTGKLHATAYILSHGPMIRQMLEAAFVYGKHETYQVPITLVEKHTGLDFGLLRGFDPLGSGSDEAAMRPVRIRGPQDLVLRSPPTGFFGFPRQAGLPER